MAIENFGRVGKTKQILDRLCSVSIDDHYNPYGHFHWPEQLPLDSPWMSRDLLTVDSTAAAIDLSDQQLIELSRCECVHFFSLNVHGIRELLNQVVSRIHTATFDSCSEFLHHFIREENDHMWFFATFCKKYGGKLYPQKLLRTAREWSAPAETFLVFAKITIFEEMVDYFNSRMADDESLDSFIREINRVHHRDESRHIAFGRQLVAALYEELAAVSSAEELSQVAEYVRRYIISSVESLYSPDVYRDAGLPGSAYDWRTRLMKDEGRKRAHQDIVRRPVQFLVKHGILAESVYV